MQKYRTLFLFLFPFSLQAQTETNFKIKDKNDLKKNLQTIDEKYQFLNFMNELSEIFPVYSEILDGHPLSQKEKEDIKDFFSQNIFKNKTSPFNDQTHAEIHQTIYNQYANYVNHVFNISSFNDYKNKMLSDKNNIFPKNEEMNLKINQQKDHHQKCHEILILNKQTLQYVLREAEMYAVYLRYINEISNEFNIYVDIFSGKPLSEFQREEIIKSFSNDEKISDPKSIYFGKNKNQVHKEIYDKYANVIQKKMDLESYESYKLHLQSTKQFKIKRY